MSHKESCTFNFRSIKIFYLPFHNIVIYYRCYNLFGFIIYRKKFNLL